MIETHAPAPAGPVSELLESRLRQQLRQGIVVWLDAEGAYTGFVDALVARSRSGTFPHPVVAYRGSFLELMLALEEHGSVVDPLPLLIHLPGFNKTTVRATPVLELYEVGRTLELALPTLVRDAAAGKVSPEELESFLSAGKPRLDAADAWLGQALTRSSEGFGSLLEQWSLDALVDAFLQRSAPMTQRPLQRAEREALAAHLGRVTGLDAPFREFLTGTAELRESPSDTADVLAGWYMAVEFVHDLERAPAAEPLRRLLSLAPALVDVCRKQASRLRKVHPELYQPLALSIEARLEPLVQELRAEDLGSVDTFQFEEQLIFRAAQQALLDGDFTRARKWAELREGDRCFWPRSDVNRKWAWALVGAAARWGEALAAEPRPLEGVRSHEEAAERYAQRAARVDRAHRHFEQRAAALLRPQLPDFSRLMEAFDALRQRQRQWADQLARDFAALCRHAGFLPPDDAQQRTLFEQVVMPLCSAGERVALFVVDALRFEMAQELNELLRAPGAKVELRARFAELPTITPVGMNALAPVARSGRLQPVLRDGQFQGFQASEFAVSTPEQRVRAMGLRVQGSPALRLELAEVAGEETERLKRRVAKSRLVVVHGTELDDAGEAGFGPENFERSLQQLASAFHNLLAAGVRQFVFTADHGFLLLDRGAAPVAFGGRREAERRHVLLAQPRQEAGLLSVSLSTLGYDGEGGSLVFREDTAAFDTGRPQGSFVHGGNSPQERLIPVLVVSHTRAVGMAEGAYAVEARWARDVLGVHVVQVRVRQETRSGLGFAMARDVDLTLRVPERPDIAVQLRDAQGAQLHPGRVRVPVGEAWATVYFALEGQHEERVRVEAFHPDHRERVLPASPEEFYLVSGAPGATEGTTPASSDWAAQLPDEETRRVFEHIERHGAVSEEELHRLMGSPRRVRRFSLDFDTLALKVPFRVRIEQAASGKRYVKEGAR